MTAGRSTGSTGGDVTTVRVVRVIPAPPERVFDAWLDPEAIRVWMCPGDIFESVAEIDATEGGGYSIVMRSPGLDDRHVGEYQLIDRPRRLRFTWSSASTHHRATLVDLTFAPYGDGACELTLLHSELPPDRVEGHAIGWRAHLRMLFDHLEAGSLPANSAGS